MNDLLCIDTTVDPDDPDPIGTLLHGRYIDDLLDRIIAGFRYGA